jgi:hypothetical protein
MFVASEDGRPGMPIVRQLGVLGCRDGALGTDGEVDPTTTLRASPGESGIIPPGAHKGVMDGAPVIVQAEIDRLHRLLTSVVGAVGLGVESGIKRPADGMIETAALRVEGSWKAGAVRR